MDYITKRELYVAPDASKVEAEDIKYVYYYYPVADQFHLKIFGGKRAKEDSYTAYRTEDEIINKINRHIQERREIQAAATERKVQKQLQQKEAFKDVKVGDIYYTSWGYDQTNVDFYKLIALKGKTGTFETLTSDIVPGSEGFMSAQVTAGEPTGKTFTSRITGDVATQMPYGQRAHKTTAGKSFQSSWYA